MITKIQLKGLTCQACQKVSQNRIGKISGVNEVKVDLKTQQAEITSERNITKEEVSKALEGTPYYVI